jgi:DNA-binding NarL/FixJ family response regulator
MRILIADDNDGVRNAIRTLLKDEADLEVCGEAADGKQALDRTRELLPDLVLLDIHMPDSDGFHVVRQLHQEFPKIKVLIVSHNDAGMLLPTALQSGAADCIDKAYLGTQLVPRLSQLLRPNAAAANARTPNQS